MDRSKKKYGLGIALLLVFTFLGRNISLGQTSGTLQDSSVIQLYGVIMSSDSLRALPGTTVLVNEGRRGTIANDNGIFSIAVQKGDRITFSCVGFKDISIQIPTKLKTDQYSVIQLLTEDTMFLPATIIQSKMSAAEFERFFIKTSYEPDNIEVARQNNEAARRRLMMNMLPNDSREAFAMQQRQQSVQYYSKGQTPPMNILNPFAWTDFVKAWKRGDFRR